MVRELSRVSAAQIDSDHLGVGSHWAWLSLIPGENLCRVGPS